MLVFRVLAFIGFVSFVWGSCGDGVNYGYCNNACYSKNQYVCYEDRILCPMTAPMLCGENSCFNEDSYQCCNGKTLYPKDLSCPPIPECCGGSGPLLGAVNQRETCYAFSDMEGFEVNTGSGLPYFYYKPCVGIDRSGCVNPTAAPSISGCRQCQLDPINDIRCKDWTPSNTRKRSGAGFQCPCEIIDYLNRTNPDILPEIYKSAPNCEVPDDCEVAPTPSVCGSTCGDGVCYQESEYVCNAPGQLCPVTAPNSCGKACYHPNSYTCCPGDVLLTGKNAKCSDSVPATNECCPAEGVLLDVPVEYRHKCYDFVNSKGFTPNPQTGEPYFSYRPCTYESDRTGCADGPNGTIINAGCRQCWLPPNEDIRCPGIRKRTVAGFECPCEIISYLYKKDPLLLPKIYRSPPQCADQLDEICLTDERYGAVPYSKSPVDLNNNETSMSVQLSMFYSLIIAAVFYVLF